MIESIKELISSTASTSIERIKNPAFGSFALSWCAFNWKQILYLLFSDEKIINRIEYISNISDWRGILGYPIVSTIIICGFMPWANNLIAKWQAKPLDNADSIENIKKAKMLRRATRLQRLTAKHDVTYDTVKTGAEKEIQKIKEDIIDSKNRMGELTKERNALIERLNILTAEKKFLEDKNTNLNLEKTNMVEHINKIEQENYILNRKIERNILSSTATGTAPPPAPKKPSLFDKKYSR